MCRWFRIGRMASCVRCSIRCVVARLNCHFLDVLVVCSDLSFLAEVVLELTLQSEETLRFAMLELLDDTEFMLAAV